MMRYPIKKSSRNDLLLTKLESKINNTNSSLSYIQQITLHKYSPLFESLT